MRGRPRTLVLLAASTFGLGACLSCPSFHIAIPNRLHLDSGIVVDVNRVSKMRTTGGRIFHVLYTVDDLDAGQASSLELFEHYRGDAEAFEAKTLVLEAQTVTHRGPLTLRNSQRVPFNRLADGGWQQGGR